jgi:putative addiction module component (TIGR02574 family)
MSSTIDQWKTQLVTLPPSERIELAYFLLTSLDPEDQDIGAAWDAEVSRRVDEICFGHATGEPVNEFIAELRERYP